MTRKPKESQGSRLSTEYGVDLSDPITPTEEILGVPIDVSLSGLTDMTTMQSLLGYIARGVSYGAACGLTGIDLRTFYRWKKRGSEKDAPKQYRVFAAALRRAEGEAELRAVSAWDSSFERDWKAAQAFLSRRFPERWGTAEQQVSVEENEDRGLKVIISKREATRQKDREEEEIENENDAIIDNDTILEVKGIVVNSEEEQENV